MPPKLDDWWSTHEQETHTSIAAFGIVPWGRKVIGRLVLAEPITACDYIRTPDNLPHIPIMVVMRGECPFYLKAHYAQLAGARMVIVVDNQYEEVEAKLMVDSAGQGEAIRIPSVLLTKQAGDKLIDSLRSKDKAVNNIKVVYDFTIPKSEKVNYNIWLSSGNAQSYRFIRDYRQYEMKLDYTSSMNIHFSHFSDNTASSNYNADNCICGGKYCAADPDGDLPNTGKDVLMEDLRQLCLIRTYQKEIWWQYATHYEESCIFGNDMKDCSQKIMEQIYVDPADVERCVQYSFDNSDLSKCTSNMLFDQERVAMTSDGVFIVPSVVINGFQYRGNLIPAHGVFEAICESFNKMPEVCIGQLDQAFDESVYYEPPTKRHMPVVGTALIFLAVFSFFVFCCYRRYLKREMYKQMVRDVNIAVSQYIAFKDEDEKDEKETEAH